MPAVSVLLPVRDAADHLETCLASLAMQSLPNFEVVAIDDGSSDSTPEILEAWQRREPRLRVHRTPPEGLVAALNRGLTQCRADLVARMDADDRAHPERLLRQVEMFRSDPSLSVVGCRVEHFSGEGVQLGLRIYETWLNSLVTHEEIWRDRFVESPIPHPAAMYRRGAVEADGGYHDRGWPEDYDLWLRLATAGHRFGKVPEVLHYWRDRSDRLTRTDPRYAVERFLECKAEHLVLGPVGACRELIIWGSGPTGRRLSKHLLRRGAPLTAFVDIDPAKWGRTVRGVEVIPPSGLASLADRRGAGLLLVAAVSSRGARAKIRASLDSTGWRETVDYWCAA